MYQLADEVTVLARAATERQNRESLPTSNQTTAMSRKVKIACIGESKVVRCMMENLMEVVATERKIVISASRCVGKFPVKKMLSDLREEGRNERWTLTFHDNTGSTQIHCSTTVGKDLKEFLEKLEKWYVEVCSSCSCTHLTVPEKFQEPIESLRLSAISSTKNVDEDNGDGEEICEELLLCTKYPEYRGGLLLTVVEVCAGFCSFPAARTDLLDDIKSYYYGYSCEMLKEALVYDGETAFVYIEIFTSGACHASEHHRQSHATDCTIDNLQT